MDERERLLKEIEKVSGKPAREALQEARERERLGDERYEREVAKAHIVGWLIGGVFFLWLAYKYGDRGGDILVPIVGLTGIACLVVGVKKFRDL